LDNPDIKTKVVHSTSLDAWHVVCTDLGKKYKVATLEYLVIDGNEVISEVLKNEALRHASFIRDCFNKSEFIIQCFEHEV